MEGVEATITHKFTPNNVREPSGAYSATSEEFLPRNSLNALIMPMDVQSAGTHRKFSKFFPNSATYLPIYHKTNTSPQVSIAVGVNTGQPLLNWIGALTPGSIWKYDPINPTYYVSGLETDPRKLLRLLGLALAPIHEAGGYVGDILNQGRVESDFSRITFDNHVSHRDGQVGGIKKDIDDFKSLITQLENLERLTNIQISSCVASRLFKRLCDDAQSLNTLEDLKEISYFVCHNPIFWGFEQRIDFVFTFYSLRELDSEKQDALKIKSRINFDNNLKLNAPPTHIPLWRHKISPNSVFHLILHDSVHGSSYTGISGLMIYHRACYLHYHEKENTSPPTPFRTIDTNLSVMFPYALPMAWYAFYLRRKVLPITNLVTVFKKQPGLLYYKKFP